MSVPEALDTSVSPLKVTYTEEAIADIVQAIFTDQASSYSRSPR